MSDPLNILPRRLAPVAGPMLWLPGEISPSDGMMALGAEHAAEVGGGGAPTPRLDALAEELRRRLDHGRGFALLRGLAPTVDPGLAMRALAGRMGEAVEPAPTSGSRYAEACDVLLLRVGEAGATRLRSAAAVHNAVLRADRGALAALYAPRGEPAVPVFSLDGGVFAGRWDDGALPADRVPGALSEAMGEGLGVPLRAGDILAVNPFLVWADRVAGAVTVACRETPSRLDGAGFRALSPGEGRGG